ncbi:chloride channel protein [Lyngbya confervoides]|uniref:Chloride channel protein n=1 Tax=Lyngbya confervoides BDU141951 TaxID=1574623 RepID=A0ABD4T1F0_9CYAN|nr:chloride channel protein [Lyngbya confervoides]MCM1982122.1 chloride channel protein [Lyngbya confervoides BDU141951]
MISRTPLQLPLMSVPPPQILPPEFPQRAPSWNDGVRLALIYRLTAFINRIRITPEALLLLTACLIGAGTGVAIAGLRTLIALIQLTGLHGLWAISPEHPHWWLPVLPLLGGGLVSLMRWQQPILLGQSLQTLLSDNREQSASILRPLLKLLAAATSIGTGASLGTEGPSAEIGANVGALLGQAFQVSKERYRLLLGAGAAAGLAAGFNAPIAGVFFALELVLPQSFNAQGASVLLISAVTASLIARAVFGVEPEFDLPAYQVLSNWEWVCYLGLGILASLVSLTYVQAIQFFQQLFQGKIWPRQAFPLLPSPWTPIIGGAGVGLLALGLPQILGVGYGTVDDILQQQAFSVSFLLLLLAGKLIATALSLGSGLVGGIFAPALFLGACLGDLYGVALNGLAPPAIAAEIAPPAAYAMVGMAAVLAGSARAPLTSLLLLFELTRNYLIILPLMAAVGVTVWLVERAQTLPKLDKLALPEMGIGLQTTNPQDWLDQVQVADFMATQFVTLSVTLLLPEAAQTMLAAKVNTAMILGDQKQLLGVLSLTDILRQFNQDNNTCATIPPTLETLCSAEVLYAYPQESMSAALARMNARGLHSLPVVDPDSPRQVLGILDRHQMSLATDWIKVRSLLAQS